MPEPPDRRTGQDRRGGRLGPGRAGGRRRAQPLRPRGDRLRARRGPRRAAALRRPRRQAREVDHRPPRGDPRAGGDRVRLQHRRRDATSPPPSSQERYDARRDRDRLARLARHRRARAASWPASTPRWTTSTSATAGWRRRRDGRHGRPSRAPRSAAAGKRVIVIGGGDTGHGLHLQLPPRGRRERASCSTSTPSCPRAVATRAHPWPLPPKRTRHHLRARGGRQAPLGHRGDRLRRQGRCRQPRLRPPGDRHLLARPDAGARAASSCSRPTSC